MDRPGRALVTGAGARVGKAMAEALGAAGWQVAVHYSSSDAGARDTVAAIEAAGGRGALVQGDLSVEEDVRRLVGDAAAALGGPLNLLVNSASTFHQDDARDFDAKGWDFHFETNLRAPVTLAQTFANALPADAEGLVVNLVDQRVWKLNPQFFTYTLSKSALWTATQTLAQALAPRIRVNAIGPGPTLKSIHQTDAEFAEEQRRTLTEKGSSPAQIVKALMFLIEADAVTGQMIAADGGQHLMWRTPDIPD